VKSGKVTKKAGIQAWLDRERPSVFGPYHAAALRREIQVRLTDRYLRDVVESGGVEVAAELGGLPHDLLALIHIETLAGAETALAGLEQRRQQGAGDRFALEALQRAGRRVREKASLVIRNTRSHSLVRQEWEEIGSWFLIWLQNPDLFTNWLELRKKSAEFRSRFAV
jgi:hypothetical protein